MPDSKTVTITAAADGSALGNPGPAGWAWYIDDDTWAAGGWKHGTNNMGELMSVLDLLRQTAHAGDQPLHVLCDSQYAINVISKWTPGWKRKGWRKADGKPVMNVELVKALDDAMRGRKVTFEWVKGHAGHRMNEAADERARAAAIAFQAGRDYDPGPGFPDAAPSTDAPQSAPTVLEVPPDLFSVVEDDTPGPAPADSRPAGRSPAALDPATLDPDLAEVVELERALLQPAVRRDRARVAELFHPEFCEVGCSGRLWTRDEMLAEIAPLPTPSSFELVAASEVRVNTALVVWRSDDALRSSLWLRTRGRWQVRFHQGTPVHTQSMGYAPAGMTGTVRCEAR